LTSLTSEVPQNLRGRQIAIMAGDGGPRGVKFGRKVNLTPEKIDHARKLIDRSTKVRLVSMWPTLGTWAGPPSTVR
jgi:hypothetical protein